MKPRYFFSLLALVALSSITGCAQNATSSSSSEAPVSSDSSFSSTPLSSSSSVSSSTWVDDDDLPLQHDDSENYAFADSTNEKGSMHYEIFVRSFYDSNGDGIGDLNGVKEKLPYLAEMGYRSLWLMPICPSPSYHGYDIANYYAINSDYGTLDDFDALVAAAKTYNIDIMIDMVLNHCSVTHPYFTQSYADYISGNTASDSKADWFTWGDGGQHSYKGTYYESRFGADMPDFNLDSTGVRAEMDKIIKFWIGHGVKGFRLDAVLYYYYNSTTPNVNFLTWLMSTARQYDPNFYMVGECWADEAIVNSYYASSCNSFFRFGTATGGAMNIVSLVKGYTRSEYFAESLENNEAQMHKANAEAYSSYFLSNHDQDRVSKNFTTPETYKAACSLYALLPGTSYTYYGEEIALIGVRTTGSTTDDLSDVKRRLPMIWSSSDKTGECKFPETNRPELNTTVQVKIGVAEQLATPFSLLNHYKMMIHLRNKYSFIKNAILTSAVAKLATSERSVLAYTLTSGSDSITIVHNFASHNVEVSAPATKILEQINTTHRLPELANGKLKLGAFSSVIMA